jgi:hypothetical protein
MTQATPACRQQGSSLAGESPELQLWYIAGLLLHNFTA